MTGPVRVSYMVRLSPSKGLTNPVGPAQALPDGAEKAAIFLRDAGAFATVRGAMSPNARKGAWRVDKKNGNADV